VVLSELAQNLSLSKTIVEKYLNILEKMFVIVNLCGFSRNLRKEISKTSKYYFLDLGVRNALIRNFNPLNLRNDKGALFENICIIERQKALSNHNLHASFYFWRTYDQKEIDLIEERGGKITGYEFKWGGKERKIKANFREFTQAYPGSILQRVTTKEIESFLNTQ
jgi:predicted AAA+ superfamily ATPase